MSQVLRTLKLAADGATGPSRSYSFYSLLLRQSSCQDSTTSLSRTSSRRQLIHRQVLSYHTEKCPLPGTTTTSVVLKSHQMKSVQSSYQTIRSMSFLTDLLRRKKKPEEEEEEAVEEAKHLPLFIEEPKQLTEEEVEAKRNISRLQPYHQRLVNGEVPYPEPFHWYHHTVKYKQKMFGKYGERSGVNPGLMWPTHDELKYIVEYEQISNPFTIQEMVEKKRAQKQQEKEAMEKRIKFVEANMAKLEQVKQDLFRRQQAKEDEANEAKARREKLVEEVRRHFGYTIDHRDERFQEMLAKKEKEQRKNMKEARKLEKQQKMLEKIQGKPDPKSREIKKKVVDDDDD